jgi:Zn-dependent protease with chaperone function
MSGPNEDNATLQPRTHERDALAAKLKTESGLGGNIIILSGDEARLNEDDKALLAQFSGTARKMGIFPAPKLFLYETEDGDDSTNAICGMIDGVYVVGISQSMKRAIQAGERSDLGSAALDRLVAVAAHEEAHIKHKDLSPTARGQEPGLDSIKVELRADKEAVRATCNPQALEESLVLSYLADARAEGTTVNKLVSEESQDASNDHPILPTRLAHLDYLKAHPPRGCKAK